jgi:Fur family ferric uptake transcriptional regulator
MKKPIQIKGNKVFVNIEGEMIETRDYSLIGAAVLQLVEDYGENKNETVKKVLNNYLEENNCRKTPERYAILEQICSTEEPFNIKDLYDIMKNSYRVSQATIYNTVRILLECGIIRRSSNSQSNELFKTTYFEFQYLKLAV